MHRVLRPAVTGEQTARLGVHVLAVQSYERPLPRLQADSVQLAGTNPELVQLAHRVRLQVDPDAKRLQLGDGLEHEARHADLLQGERDTESADSATGNEYGQIGHRDSSAWIQFRRRESPTRVRRARP